MPERPNQPITHRTLLVQILPDKAICLRLVRALAVEMREGWIEQNRHLEIELPVEQHGWRVHTLIRHLLTRAGQALGLS